jgi:hypothetical protein
MLECTFDVLSSGRHSSIREIVVIFSNEDSLGERLDFTGDWEQWNWTRLDALFDRPVFSNLASIRFIFEHFEVPEFIPLERVAEEVAQQFSTWLPSAHKRGILVTECKDLKEA